MNPAQHPNATRAPGQPLDWDEAKHDPVIKLPIADIEEDGLPFMESLWALDSLERAALIAGEKVILRIQGHTHPVVSLGVTAPAEPKKFSAARHNKLAPELTMRLLLEAPAERDAMMVLESVILGVMLRFRPQAREAGEFLDAMTARVIERLG